MPQPLATPIQKKRAAGAQKAPRAKKTLKEPPEPICTYALKRATLTAAEVLGDDASIDDLIACCMMLRCGRRNRWNGPTRAGSRARCRDAAWLFHQHVEVRNFWPTRIGFLDKLRLTEYCEKRREWELAMARGQPAPEPEHRKIVGRDCGHGSTGFTTVYFRGLKFEDLQEWKRELPLYLRAGQERAYVELHRRTNVRRAWALLRRHARAVDLAARVALYWQERTQMALCAPDGAGRAADCAAFAAEF